jgi:hypothetical protein
MQISIDGTDLFPTAGNTATATSDMGDIAIAITHLHQFLDTWFSPLPEPEDTRRRPNGSVLTGTTSQ